MTLNNTLTIIGTCPTYEYGLSGAAYLERIHKAAARAESQAWSAMLVYSDHKQFDPWLAAGALFSVTKKVSPLIAVQPLYMHPFAVAKAVVSMSILYNRPVHLNFISGGFPHDLEAFVDTCPHDARYDRVGEYSHIIRSLLSDKKPLSFNGKYYNISNLQFTLGSILPSHCFPIFTISGSSPAGLDVARKIKARAIQYLRPFKEYTTVKLPSDLQYGTRLGIIVRENSADAWVAARRQYPDDPGGAEVRKYYARVSDSVWVKELGKEVVIDEGHPYWLGPYRNNQAACPFLVGSREDVARELAGYIEIGLRTFLVENPESDEDAEEITTVFEMAQRFLNRRGQFL